MASLTRQDVKTIRRHRWLGDTIGVILLLITVALNFWAAITHFIPGVEIFVLDQGIIMLIWCIVIIINRNYNKDITDNEKITENFSIVRKQNRRNQYWVFGNETKVKVDKRLFNAVEVGQSIKVEVAPKCRVVLGVVLNDEK